MSLCPKRTEGTEHARHDWSMSVGTLRCAAGQLEEMRHGASDPADIEALEKSIAFLRRQADTLERGLRSFTCRFPIPALDELYMSRKRKER